MLDKLVSWPFSLHSSHSLYFNLLLFYLKNLKLSNNSILICGTETCLLKVKFNINVNCCTVHVDGMEIFHQQECDIEHINVSLRKHSLSLSTNWELVIFSQFPYDHCTQVTAEVKCDQQWDTIILPSSDLLTKWECGWDWIHYDEKLPTVPRFDSHIRSWVTLESLTITGRKRQKIVLLHVTLYC